MRASRLLEDSIQPKVANRRRPLPETATFQAGALLTLYPLLFVPGLIVLLLSKIFDGGPLVAHLASVPGAAPRLIWRAARERNLKLLGSSLMILALLIIAVVSSFASGRESADAFQPPSWAHPLGTTFMGKDVGYLVILGCRNSLIVVETALLVVLTVGVSLGVFCWLPLICSSVTRLSPFAPLLVSFARALLDAIDSIPSLFVLMVLVGLAPRALGSVGLELATSEGAWVGPLVVGALVGIWLCPTMARLVAARIQSFHDSDYYDAAVACNIRPSRVILRHVLLRGSLPEILMLAAHLAGIAVLVEVSIGYLFKIGAAERGGAFYFSLAHLVAEQEARDALLLTRERLWLVIPPLVAIAVLILSFRMHGEALREYAHRLEAHARAVSDLESR